MWSLRAFCVLLTLNYIAANGERKVPVVLWHGMGDSCCFSFSMDRIKSAIQDTLPGTYVYSVRVGSNVIEDVERSYLDNINNQIQEICEVIKADENLKDGYNAIGFSQGSQFLRALIQRCAGPPVMNYVSFGGQHQGVFGAPFCAAAQRRLCELFRRILRYGAYAKHVQEHFVQAAYWHDPLHEAEYRNNSIFLPDVNNELFINQDYKERLLGLEKMVLVKFKADRQVTPAESEWFGFFETGQDTKVIPMQETDLYKQDRLGLRELAETGRLDLLELPGDHLQFGLSWFVENIVKKYLV